MAFSGQAAFAGGASNPMDFVQSFLAGGFFGGKKNFDMSGINDLISQRQSQIDQFSAQLDANRNNLLANQRNLATSAMGFALPAMQAKLGAQGLSANGGALNSAMAAAAMPYQQQYDVMNANMTNQDLTTEASLNQNLFQQKLGARQFGDITNFNIDKQYRDQMMQGYSSLFSPTKLMGQLGVSPSQLMGAFTGSQSQPQGGGQKPYTVGQMGPSGNYQGMPNAVSGGANPTSAVGGGGAGGNAGMMAKLLSMFAG